MRGQLGEVLFLCAVYNLGVYNLGLGEENGSLQD